MKKTKDGFMDGTTIKPKRRFVVSFVVHELEPGGKWKSSLSSIAKELKGISREPVYLYQQLFHAGGIVFLRLHWAPGQRNRVGIVALRTKHAAGKDAKALLDWREEQEKRTAKE